MANSDFGIGLRNYAGIPVVELTGEVNKKTLSTLEEILKSLVGAGHFNVMINLKRAVWQNLAALASLEKVAGLFRTHYGNVEVIAEMEQIDRLRQSISKPLSGLLRFCTSEGQALMRIKKLPAPSAGGVRPMPARLTESR